MYEATGKIKVIFDTQSFPSGFSKREFVVTIEGKFPQDLKFEVVKDKCAMLDDFHPDQSVQVNFDIRGNEYNGKYYVNLSCWKLQPADGTENQPAPQQRGGGQSYSRQQSPPPRQNSSQAEPSAADLRNNDDFDDDIPF